MYGITFKAYPSSRNLPLLDGPEIDLIQFFREHPEGKRGGIAHCFHLLVNTAKLRRAMLGGSDREIYIRNG